METIVLASGSPRRFELLSPFFDLEVRTSNAEEIIAENAGPSQAVMDLAEIKASSVAKTLDKDSLIIGADTIVCINDIILGKPADEQDAFQMLKMLSNTAHQVYTGFCIIRNSDGKTVIDYEKTNVYFRLLDQREITAYIATGEPMDKAGAYGIQGLGGAFITHIEGDYNNVVGLPVCKLLSRLKNDFAKEIFTHGNHNERYRD